MIRFSSTLLCCSSAASLAMASANGTATPAINTTDSEWSKLDRDVERLAASLTQSPAPGVQVGALLRTSFDLSRDQIYELDGNGDGNPEDLNGFHVEDAEIWVQGSVGAFDVRLMADGSDYTGYPTGAPGGPPPPAMGYGQPGTLNTRDAWARWNDAVGITNVDVYMGQFKCPAVMSGATPEDSLLMIDRTRMGQLFDVWQPGVAVTGDFGALHFKVAAQNGADGAGDELGIVARAEYQFGAGAKHREGAYGAQDFDATIGIAYFEDSSEAAGVEFGSAVIVDGYATLNAFSFQGEVLDMDEEFSAKMVGNTSMDEATPYAATLGFMFVPDRWEAAVRYQDLDNDLDTTILGGGINYYASGHNAKWQLNYSVYDDDNDDGSLLQIGLTVGASHP